MRRAGEAATLAAPFALPRRRRGPGSGSASLLRAPLGRGSCEELVDRAGDVAGDRVLVPVGAHDDEAARLAGGETEVAVAHALEERAVVGVEPVPALLTRVARAQACERHLDGRVE